MPRKRFNPFEDEDDDGDDDFELTPSGEPFARVSQEMIKLGVTPDVMGTLFDDANDVILSAIKKFGVKVLTMSLQDSSQVFLEVIQDRLKEKGISTSATMTIPQKISWQLAASFRATPINLPETLNQFTANQLREMAKMLGIKIKGVQKAGIIESMCAGLNDFIAQMKDDPNAFLAGLDPEPANFVRKLFTAYDAEGLIPHSVGKQFLQDSIIPMHPADINKRSGVIFDTLNKRGMIFTHFPTNTDMRSRGAFFQWLPIGKLAHYVPVWQWPDSVLTPKREADKLKPDPKSSQQLNFLDSFDAFLVAVHAGGVEWRQYMQPHAKTMQTSWLAEWEHNAEEAEKLINSRKGWSPDMTAGMSVKLLPHLTLLALQALESQTGLSAEQITLFFTLAAALQLFDTPNNVNDRMKGAIRVFINAVAYETWLTLSAETRLQRLWLAWAEQTVYASEVTHAIGKLDAAPNFKVMRAIGANGLSITSLGAEWCGLRRFMVRALRGLPSKTWVNWTDFRRMLFDLHPDAAHMQHSDADWWFALPISNNKLNQSKYEEWQKSTGAIMALILTESLQWFGAIECDRGSGIGGSAAPLRAFRITPLGEWLFTCLADATAAKLPVVAKPQPRQHEPIVWVDNLTWRVPPAPDRAALVRFSRTIGDAEGAPSTYTLTPSSAERALQQGITLAEFDAQFAIFGVTVPVAVKQRFAEIAEHFGRVRLYEGLTVLQLADDIALRELLASTSLAKFVVYQISPRAVVIDDAGVDVLAAEMVAQGHTPKINQ